MEAVGLVLGVVPLLISAAEHYHDLWKPFARYRNFDPAFMTFQSELKTQNALYQTEVLLLLKKVFGRHQAGLMQKDYKHKGWLDVDTESKLMKYLDGNGPACIAVLQNIEALLKDIRAKESYFAEASFQNRKDRTFASQPWRHEKSARFKFAISDSRLEKDIKRLRQFNEDFRTLANQADRNANTQYDPILLEESTKKLPVAYTISNGMQIHRTIQKTSKILYDNLTKACTKHTEHRAFLSLQPLVKKGSNFDIRYEIGYHNPPHAVSATHGLHWMMVESHLGQSLVTNETREKDKIERIELGNTAISRNDNSVISKFYPSEDTSILDNALRKRRASPDTSSDCAQPWKLVKYQAQSMPEQIFVASLSSFTPHFREYQDLCTHLLRVERSVDNSGRCCLGPLGQDTHCKLVLYLTSPPKSCQAASVSFSSILTQINNGDFGELQPQERIRFAKLLATAALQFQSTPWLNNGMWRSENLCLFGSDQTKKALTSSTIPYMDVVVKTPTTLAQDTASITSPWINNPILFGLSLMLIELAYERPFNTLINEADQRAGCRPVDIEYATAKRMMKTMSSKLGPRFRNVAQKCLIEDFGDLTQHRPQERYHAEVIDTLHELEVEFQKMYLDGS